MRKVISTVRQRQKKTVWLVIQACRLEQMTMRKTMKMVTTTAMRNSYLYFFRIYFTLNRFDYESKCGDWQLSSR